MLPSPGTQPLLAFLNELAETSSFPETVQKVLRFLIKEAGAQGAAAFIRPGSPNKSSLTWYTEDVPPEWLQQIQAGEGPVFQTAAALLAADPLATTSSRAGFLGGFALHNQHEIYGGILLYQRGITLNLPPSTLTPLSNAANWLISRSLAFFEKTGELDAAGVGVQANRGEIIRSRNILRALFDSLPNSIYIIDPDYTIVALNYSRAKRAAAEPSQLVGKICFEAFYNRSQPCPECLVHQTLMKNSLPGEAVPSTTRVSHTWTEEQFSEWEISTFAVMNDSNQPGQAIIIEQEITDKRKLEASLIQSEKLAAVGQLAASIMHEINNPLTVIIANSQILARELAENSEQMESVKLIELAGSRASQVVRNLLSFTRKEKYDFKPVGINDTIRDAVMLLQHKLHSQGVDLQLDLHENLPHIFASRDHLEGVWVNLMLNALDAMHDQESAKLNLTSRAAKNELRVTVADNGQGIPPERLSHIFEPFYTTKSQHQGTGLGLSICLQIVKNHGGLILVDSQVDAGTRFTVVLPITPP
jgi:signal transduction histidine kinase